MNLPGGGIRVFCFQITEMFADRIIGPLNFHQHDRFPALGDHKIHFSAVDISEIAQFNVAPQGVFLKVNLFQ